MKLYTKTVCPKCIVAKAVLEEEGVRYETVNTDQDDVARELLLGKGFMGVPVAEHEGEFYASLPEIQGLIQKLK
jgi:glutaredoxin